MELAALLISALAFGLSGFTFYWLDVRERKAFYLIRVDRMLGMKPEFALVNGGSKDLLVTTIMCGFIGKEKNSCSYPAQNIEIGNDQTLLVSAGISI